MALILWLCPVIPGGPGVTGPRVVKALDALPQPHVSSWDTTDSARAAPYAVGCSDVDAVQQAALEVDPLIILLPQANWAQTYDTLLASGRLRIRQFCDTIGVARPANNEVCQDLCSRLTLLLNVRLIDVHIGTVLGRLAQRQG